MTANLEILIPFVPFFFSRIFYITVTTCATIVFIFLYWNNKRGPLKALLLTHLPPPHSTTPIRSSTAHSCQDLPAIYYSQKRHNWHIHSRTQTHAHTSGCHSPPHFKVNLILLRYFKGQMPIDPPPPPPPPPTTTNFSSSSMLHPCINIYKLP